MTALGTASGATTESSTTFDDSIQGFLAGYASGLHYESLPQSTIHAAKGAVIDTLAVLVAGFTGAPCKLARNYALLNPQADGATLIGTSHRVAPDVAAFVNGTTARFIEMNDVYHRVINHVAVRGGHPSDVISPVLSVAEYAHASGKAFIEAVVLAYEVYLRLADETNTTGFDTTTLAGIAVAAASAKVLGLSQSQIGEAISIAVVSNNPLNVTRTGHVSMWKAIASGQAGRGGVLAALLARENMTGPRSVFEGKYGWLDHVAGKRFELASAASDGSPYKVEQTLIKQRPGSGSSISASVAAEKAHAGVGDPDGIERIVVELYRHSLNRLEVLGEHAWNPPNREIADHSIPYIVAAALREGRITPRQFDDAHLSDPRIRSTIAKIELVENPEFTAAYEGRPAVHRARVTVTKTDGSVVIGESDDAAGDPSVTVKSDSAIGEKFTSLTQEYFGRQKVEELLTLLWSLDEVADVATLPHHLLI